MASTSNSSSPDTGKSNPMLKVIDDPVSDSSSTEVEQDLPQNPIAVENEVPPVSNPKVPAKKDAPEEFKPDRAFYLAFSSLAILTAVVALDGTTPAVALPTISNKLGGTSIEAFWTGTSFLLASAVFMPSYASFSHIFGRKPVIQVATVLFLIGTIIGGLSKNFTYMLVGRSIQGVGGGGIISLTQIIITDLVPLRHRGKWFGVVQAMWAFGTIFGPVIGGAFAGYASWRWIFWINLPFIGIGLVSVPLFIRLNFLPTSLVQKLKRVDYIGSFIFVASLTSFLIPITWGGLEYSWSSWHTLVPLLLGAFGLIFFVIYEELVAKSPLIPMVVFKNRTASISYFGVFVHGITLWSSIYFRPLYFEGVKQFSPMLTGVAFLPQAVFVSPIAVATGIIVTKTGRYRWAVWSGWVFTTLGCGLLVIQDVHTSTVAWVWFNIIIGIGFGILFPALMYPVQAATSNKNIAFAVGIFGAMRVIGETVGIAIAGTIFQNQLRTNLLGYPSLAGDAQKYSVDAQGLVPIIKAMAEGPVKEDLLQAYTDALKVVWGVMCALAGVAGFLSLGTKGLSLDRRLKTDQALKVKNEVKGDLEGGSIAGINEKTSEKAASEPKI